MRPPFVPRPTQVAASALTIAAAAAVAVPSAYLLVISAAGLLPRRRRSDGVEPETRFTILVPAHNEAAGIGRTLEAFNALDYPSDLFSVHVVADNCSDDTAEVVRRSRWTVHERRAPDDPGKGPALNWLLDELVAGGEAFDAILIVDADSTLAPGFLRAMDQVAREGIQAAQGYYSVRDADLSPAASFRFAALACRHHLRPLGRTRLGGSAGLYGNGMMFTRSLFDGRRWTGHLVEDAELQNELLLEGHARELRARRRAVGRDARVRVSGDEPEPSMGARPHRAGPAIRAEASRRARRGARPSARPRRRRLRSPRPAALGARDHAALRRRHPRGRGGARSPTLADGPRHRCRGDRCVGRTHDRRSRVGRGPSRPIRGVAVRAPARGVESRSVDQGAPPERRGRVDAHRTKRGDAPRNAETSR